MTELEVSSTTNIHEVVNDLGGGIVQQIINQALNEVANKTCEHGANGKEGEVTISLKFTPAKEGEQLVVTSKIKKKVPTDTGHSSEYFTNITSFFLDQNGKMCGYVPEATQGGQGNMEV